MAFLFGAFLGLVVGVAVVMAFARFENSRAEQRRELVRVCVYDPIPPLRSSISRCDRWFCSIRFRVNGWCYLFLDLRRFIYLLGLLAHYCYFN